MLTRRTAAALFAGAAVAPSRSLTAASGGATVFYNAVGPNLTWWHVDIGNAALARQHSVTLPALVQYAWRHPTKPILYVASSNFVPMGGADAKHHITAWRGNRRAQSVRRAGVDPGTPDQHLSGRRRPVAADRV